MERQYLYSVLEVVTSPAQPCILFCFSCWMYYSVIPKLDKGEAGMLEVAGDLPACQRASKERVGGIETHNDENTFLRGP